jgi:peptidoglycan/LPS O-acetylase OafA/YrhL
VTAPTDRAPSRDNDFDAIRLVAALAVLVGHAWPLTGVSHPPRLAGLPIFELGVDIFFALSGFLIATSWARSPRVVPFLLRRVFRIFPALILLVLITVFVLGPVVSALGPAAYFGDPGSWAYLSNVTLAATYHLPGVFLGNPVEGVVNGSLWTLGPEFLCYLAVLAVGLVVLRAARQEALRLVAFATLGILLVVVQTVPGLAPAGTEDVLRVVVFFAAGAVLSELDRLGMLGLLRRRAVVLVLAAAWLIAGAVLPGDAATPLAWLVLPCVVVGLGVQSTPGARRAARFGDLSYGLYLWGYPVQQTVVLVAPGLPLGLDIMIVAIITGALALASWWLVEHRSIGVGRRLGERFRMMRSEIVARS